MKFIKEIDVQHVDLPPDNPHVLRYTGRLFSWGNNLQEKIKHFIRFAGKKPVYVIAQDAASCVVYGMPKAVAEAGVVDEVVPLNDVAKSIIKNVGVK